MTATDISLILLTTGRQPLVRYTLQSLLPQLDGKVEFIISINARCKEDYLQFLRLFDEFKLSEAVKIIRTPAYFSVYEHYNFALKQSTNLQNLIVHDDELYNANLLEEFRTGLREKGVTLVVGGMLKVKPWAGKFHVSRENCSQTTDVINGLDWIRENPELFPKFCYSALHVNKTVLNLELFSSESTSADCLAVTKQALAGKVWHSSQVFGTWLQLPTRNSRLYQLSPGLKPTWKEYLELYVPLGDTALIDKAIAAKKMAVKNFLWILFAAGLREGDGNIIRNSLEKLAQIKPRWSQVLKFLEFRVVYITFSKITKIIFWLYVKYTILRRKNQLEPQINASVLNLDSEICHKYVQKISALARKH